MERRVKLYALSTCAWCKRIKKYLDTREIEFEVVRRGDYFLYRAPDSKGELDPSPPIGIEIDGAPAGRLIRDLTKGQHVISLEPGSEPHILAILPPEAIPALDPDLERKKHSRWFEYFVHD